MGKSEYAEKFKSPKWQRKRLEVMKRDNFKCQICGNSEDTLNVHHICYYDEPWDVDDSYLITLCETCHAHEHNNKHIYNAIQSLRDSGVTTFEIMHIIDSIATFMSCNQHLIVDILDFMQEKTGCNVLPKNRYDCIKRIADRREQINKELWEEAEK